MNSVCDKIKEVHTWSKEDRQVMRSLAKWSLDHWPALYHAFARVTMDLARIAGETGFDWAEIIKLDHELIALSAQNRHAEAGILFATYLVDKVDKHMPGCAYPEYLRLKEELAARQPLPSQSASS